MPSPPFLTVALICFLLSAPSYAWPPTIGFEPTVTSPFIKEQWLRDKNNRVGRPEVINAQKRLQNFVRKNICPAENCRIVEVINEYDLITYRVEFPNGFWMQISPDSAAVEAQFPAATTADIEKDLPKYQALFFDAAAKSNLTPDDSFGDGHIHLGLDSTFGGDVRLFRNFVVDYINHLELSTGIFGNAEVSAPNFYALEQGQKDAFNKLLADFDLGKVDTIEEFCRRLNTEVYTKTPGGVPPPQKYQALNVTRVGNKKFPRGEWTVELRGHRPQKNAREMLLLARYYEARVSFLKGQSGLVAFRSDQKPNLAKQEKVNRYGGLLKETGLNWEEYRVFSNFEHSGMRPSAGAEKLITEFYAWEPPPPTLCQRLKGWTRRFLTRP